MNVPSKAGTVRLNRIPEGLRATELEISSDLRQGDRPAPFAGRWRRSTLRRYRGSIHISSSGCPVHLTRKRPTSCKARDPGGIRTEHIYDR